MCCHHIEELFQHLGLKKNANKEGDPIPPILFLSYSSFVSPIGPLGSSSGKLPHWLSNHTKACPTSKFFASSWRAAFWTSRTTALTCCMYFLRPLGLVTPEAGPLLPWVRESIRRGLICLLVEMSFVGSVTLCNALIPSHSP